MATEEWAVSLKIATPFRKGGAVDFHPFGIAGYSKSFNLTFRPAPQSHGLCARPVIT
jgi:hypothetical protein